MNAKEAVKISEDAQLKPNLSPCLRAIKGAANQGLRTLTLELNKLQAKALEKEGYKVKLGEKTGVITW